MQVNVVKIGNSRGIRIPKKVLDQCQVDDVLELTVKENNILLRPVHRKPREGWAAAIEAVHEKLGNEEIDHGWMDADLSDDRGWEW